METEKEYSLYGFIEYVPVETGFVTAIFSDGPELFMQVTSDNSSIARFKPFRDPDNRIIKYGEEDVVRKSGDDCLFVFKLLDSFHHNGAAALSDLLVAELHECRDDEYLYKIVNSFIETYSSSFGKYDAIFPGKEKVWEECLDILKTHFGKTAEDIYRNVASPESFKDNVLRVEFLNKILKSTFDFNFTKGVVKDLKQNYGPGCEIETTYKEKRSADIYERNEFHHEEKSYIIGYNEASNQPYHQFDNFVLTKHNQVSFFTGLKAAISGLESDHTIIITGKSGVGKTHLTHAIGNYLTDMHRLNIAWFSVFETAIKHQHIFLKNAVEFESLTCEAEVIVIDDCHYLFANDTCPGPYLRAIMKASVAGKKIIMTYNEEYSHVCFEIIPCLSRDTGIALYAFNTPDEEDMLTILKRKAHIDDLSPGAIKLLHSTAAITKDIASYLNFAALLLINKELPGQGGRLKQHGLDYYKKFLADQQARSRNMTPEKLIDIQKSVCKHLDYDFKKLRYAVTYPKDIEINDIIAFLFEFFFGVFAGKEFMIPVFKSKHYSFDYWRQRLSDNTQFRKLAADVLEDLERGQNLSAMFK